jgi:hypothetical protein
VTTLSIFNPAARDCAGPSCKRTVLDTLEGKVVGFIDNSKPNFSLLVEDMTGLLKTQYGVKSTLTFRKRTPTIAAPDEVMNDMLRQCDLIITGSGD